MGDIRDGGPDRAAQRKWKAMVAPYEGPDNGRSARQLAISVVLHLAGWAAMLRSLDVGLWLALIVGLPAAGLMVRLFIIQHDCGGNLDRRGFGDIGTLTTEEYEALDFRGRIGYRIIRSPVLLIGILTTFHFVVVHRFPWMMPREWQREWRSVWWTNAAVAGVLAVAWSTVGIDRFLVIQGILILYGCAFAGWLTHTQHQFEDAYWRRGGDWDRNGTNPSQTASRAGSGKQAVTVPPRDCPAAGTCASTWAATWAGSSATSTRPTPWAV